MIEITTLAQIRDKIEFRDILKKEYNDDYKYFISEISLSLNKLYRISISDANRYLDAVIACFKFIPKEFHDKLIAMRARVALWNTEYTKSIVFYKKALTQTVAKRDFHTAAMIRKGMIEVYMYLSQYDNGLEVGKKALAYFKHKNKVNDAAQVMTNIGNMYHRMDKNRLALSYYDKAKKIFSEQGGIACAIVDFNRANIFANMNELSRAKKLYIEAGLFYKNANMELAYQQTEYSIAYILFLESKYTEALGLFERVYDSFEDLGDKTASAVTQLDLAELNLQLNQYGSTILLSDMVIPIFRNKNMPYEEGKAFYFSAIAKLELGDISQSKHLLQTAKKIFEKEKNNLWLGMIEFAYSSFYTRQKKYKEALNSSILAKKYYKKSKDIRREHDADLAFIEALFLSHMSKVAFAKITKLQKHEITLEQQRKLHVLIGEYYFINKNYKLAQVEFEKAVVIVEKMMKSLHYDEIKYFFAADKFKIYSRIVECSLKLGKIEVSYLQNLKALSLLNQKIVSVNTLQGNVPDKILSQIESLRSILAQAYKFPHKGNRVAVDSHDILKHEKQLWQLEQKARAYNNFENKKVQYPSNDFNTYTPSKNEVVLNYYISENKVGIYVQSATNIRFVDLPVTLNKLTNIIRKIQFLFEQSIHNFGDESACDIKKAYLQKLFALLLEPIQLDETIDTLKIVPDGILNQIPFIALCDENNNFVRDKYTVKIISDPLSMNNETINKIDFSKLQNSIFSVSHESLPLVEVESDKIYSKFKKASYYKKKKANTTNFKNEMKKSTGFIHIATHASRSSENPLFSRLLFSDGILFPFDLYGQGIQAELVTLSGCQTAAPGLNYGNTFSLAKAFYRAGCRFVLASLWPVDDKVTMLFMNEFYTQLSHLKSVEKAYQKAVKYISAKIDDPAFWGAFILIGN